MNRQHLRAAEDRAGAEKRYQSFLREFPGAADDTDCVSAASAQAGGSSSSSSSVGGGVYVKNLWLPSASDPKNKVSGLLVVDISTYKLSVFILILTF